MTAGAEVGRNGGSWAIVREETIMDLLAFLGRCGYQSADALARGRDVRWISSLARSVGKILEAETAAMKNASRGSGS
jgi:hypothetical protein